MFRTCTKIILDKFYYRRKIQMFYWMFSEYSESSQLRFCRTKSKITSSKTILGPSYKMWPINLLDVSGTYKVNVDYTFPSEHVWTFIECSGANWEYVNELVGSLFSVCCNEIYPYVAFYRILNITDWYITIISIKWYPRLYITDAHN